MKRAFTLIELLASIALLALLVIMGVAMVSSTSRVSGTTVRRTELREEARSVFDRMALDLSSIVRFDAYQLKATTTTNSVISLISSTGEGGNVRLQRIDYQVTTNGLFRYVRDVGWNDSQDLGGIPQGTGELLSPAVGRLVTQAIMNDGSTLSNLDIPTVRGNLHPVGLMVGLALADTQQRRLRNLIPPGFTTNTNGTWIALSVADEKMGWRLSESTLRLP